ncbi:MAG: hypothetical protein ACRC12_00970, partial [Holosporales bacterium]
MFYLFFVLLLGTFSFQAKSQDKLAEDITLCGGLGNVTEKYIVTPLEGVAEGLFTGTSAVVSESGKVSVRWGESILKCSSKTAQGTGTRAVQGGEVVLGHLGQIPDTSAALIKSITDTTLLTAEAVNVFAALGIKGVEAAAIASHGVTTQTPLFLINGTTDAALVTAEAVNVFAALGIKGVEAAAIVSHGVTTQTPLFLINGTIDAARVAEEAVNALATLGIKGVEAAAIAS